MLVIELLDVLYVERLFVVANKYDFHPRWGEDSLCRMKLWTVFGVLLATRVEDTYRMVASSLVMDIHNDRRLENGRSATIVRVIR